MGGVDSTVVATLIDRAIHSKLHLLYVENGLMRQGTKERVVSLFKNATIIHAEKLFLDSLRDVTNPEQKRKVFIY